MNTATTTNGSWTWVTWSYGNNPPPPEPPGTAGVPAIVPPPPFTPVPAMAAPEDM